MHHHRVVSIAVAALLLVPAPASSQVTLAARRPAPSTFALDIGGVRVNALSVDPGYFTASIATNDLGPGSAPKKHVSAVRFTPFTARVDPMGMGKGLENWVTGTLETGYLTKSGTYVSQGGKDVASQLTFVDALITRIAFTGLDVARPACQLEVTFEPMQMRVSKSGGAIPPVPMERIAPCTSVRVSLGSFAAASAAVTRIDSIVVTVAVAADQVGITSEPSKHPARVSIANVTLTLPEARSQELQDWAKQWMVDGSHDEKNELPLTVTLGSAGMKDAITLQGQNVGLVALRPPFLDASGQRMVQVELYVEKWTMTVATPPAPATTTATTTTVPTPPAPPTR